MARRKETRFSSCCAIDSATSCASRSGRLISLDINEQLLGSELLYFFFELLNLSAALADYYARLRGIDDNLYAVRRALDLDFGIPELYNLFFRNFLIL